MKVLKITAFLAITLMLCVYPILFSACSDDDDNDDTSQPTATPTPTPTAGTNTPPDTEITDGPDIATSYPVTFTFTGTDAEDSTDQLTYAFRMDSGSWSAWQSGTTASYDDLTEGEHTFEVKARDSGGLEDETPADWSFTVYISSDDIPPETWIVSGPEGTVDYTDVTFVYSGSDNESVAENLMYSFEFSDWGWSEYSHDTQVTLSGLSNGTYQFSVRARDEAGNVDPTPDTRSFTIETVAYAIWLDPATQSQNGNPGDELTYHVDIQNTGSNTGNFIFEVRTDFPDVDWNGFFCLSDGTCVVSGTSEQEYGPGETDWMDIHIIIGNSASSGDTGTATLSATCVQDASVYEESEAVAITN